ncbi:unnamed protein product, partial [Iphiclides podalirius]
MDNLSSGPLFARELMQMPRPLLPTNDWTKPGHYWPPRAHVNPRRRQRTDLILGMHIRHRARRTPTERPARSVPKTAPGYLAFVEQADSPVVRRSGGQQITKSADTILTIVAFRVFDSLGFPTSRALPARCVWSCAFCAHLAYNGCPSGVAHCCIKSKCKSL